MTQYPTRVPTVAVITLVRGRSAHLRRQMAGLAALSTRPELYVVVALGDPDVRATVGSAGLAGPTRVVDLEVGAGAELPLAEGRNLGAATAIAAGADVLVFLDVDCIPAPRLIQRYRDAAGDARHAGALLCGPVAYLPPPGPGGYDLTTLAQLARPHASRPDPDDGTVLVAADRRLFWSLSFAVTAPTWRRIGGFCSEYRGYGGEDTDFAELAAAAGVGMRWVGGATAYHQHHPVSAPPVEHVASIVANAHVFHRRWQWWPMAGWLDQFAELGLARLDPSQGWVVTP